MEPAMIHKLEADSIMLSFDGRKILSDIYVRSETGAITGLLGRNGAGKTCLMNAILGTMQCDRSVRIDGRVYYEAFMTRGVLSYLPQFEFIPRRLTVSKVLRDYEADSRELLDLFPQFSRLLHDRVGTLSAGEHRILEIFAVISRNTLFAILDEPFSFLSPIQIEQVKKLIATKKFRKGFIITDHQYQHVLDITDSCYLLKDGKTHLVNSLDDLDRLGYIRL
ncbi:MAG: ATP-binding cassette domain-containing protein [Chitinophagaceae bacterium]|nr:MAG: ATP-binding cassette domain-containing protein [Chitinophagaceae bacterium]